MDTRVLFFIVLVTSNYCNARVVTTSLSPIQDAIASKLQINHQQHKMEDQATCTFCQVILAPIVAFLSNTTNQSEIMAFLHLICSFTFFKDECNSIVDHYVPLIFNQTSSSTPKEICKIIGLCEGTNVSWHLSENSWESCQHAVTEASLKLNHPDSQLHIVEMLLKACNAMEEDFVNTHCKRVVSANAVLITAYANQMLDGHAICNLLYDCSSPTNAAEQAFSSETYLHSAY